MSGAAFTPDPSLPSILELAKKLWGEPTDWSADKNEVRFGANGSKSIKIRECVWQDHEANEGGGYLEIYRKAEGALPPRKGNGLDKGPKPWLDIDKIYPYVNDAGVLVLEVIRTKSRNPRFRQRKPDASKPFGWDWKTRDIPYARRPLYRLPQLLAADETDLVFITEGEKDADNLASRGLIATTNSGGAGKWCPEYAEMFRGKHVVVLPDNDPAGEGHIRVVAGSVHGVAASLRVLALPGLAHKGDVSDWLAAGGTAGGLQRLALEAPLWVPPILEDPPGGPGGPGGDGGDGEGPPDYLDNVPPPGGVPGGPRPGQPPQLPVIQCVAGQLPRMVREAEDALLAAGAPIYQRAVLVRPAEQEYPAADGSTTHSAALVAITGPAMMGLLSHAATWVKFDARRRGGGEWVECDPPQKVVEILLANRGLWRFPVVRGVLTSPTIRPNGSLLTTPGYDPESRYYLMFPTSLVVPTIAEKPTLQEAGEALDRLNDLLDGYDFIDDGGVSRSVALAMLMTQVLRCGMSVSPLLAVSATAPGSGKSHLVDLASTIAIGRPCPIMGAGKNDEETEKGINTNLLSGVAGFSIDNVHRSIDLAVLNIATERPMVSIRLFGTLTNVEVENACTIYMTGNNLPVVDEQVRRTLLCSLDTGVEQPEQRDFANGDPIAAVLKDRGRTIADVLTIARAYLAYGYKQADMRPFGSYPGWSRLVREPLMWLGQPDPVLSQNASRASDPEMTRLRTVISAWHAVFGTTAYTLAEVVRHVTQPPLHPTRQSGESSQDYDERVEGYARELEKQPDRDALRDVLVESWGHGKDIDRGRFGNWLRRYSGRIVGKMLFSKADVIHSAVQWRVTTPR